MRICLQWEPVCWGRGSEQGAAASRAQARPFPVVALPLDAPGPCTQPKLWGGLGGVLLVPARSRLVSLQQVRQRSLREALLSPLCVMGGVEGFFPAGTPSPS